MPSLLAKEEEDEDAVRARRLAALHAFAWLVAGNAVGLLLALLWLAPRAGRLLGPFTWGRWAPVHLDVQLYGWASLPLVALLFRLYLPGSRSGRLPALAVQAWSGAVLCGALSTLAGGSSGKPFLEWSGPARWALVLAMALLAVTLVRACVRAFAHDAIGPRLAKGLLLLVLVPIPFVMAWAASPAVYPSINPDSGGATGGSLLGSSLGIVLLIAATPFLLGLAPRRRGVVLTSFVVLALHAMLFGLLDHGDHSHRESLQRWALGSLAIWPPILALHLREFAWPPGARRWLLAAGCWGLALVATGLLAFQPGVLESWKFSNSLVAHAHLALAGFVSSWNLLVLSVLTPTGALAEGLAQSRSFVAWHGGLVVHLGALFGLGAVEASSPGGLLPEGTLPDALLVLRASAGLVQLLASWHWLRSAWSSYGQGLADGQGLALSPEEAAA